VIDEKTIIKWEEFCPLCGAKGCATFLGFYKRKKVYDGDEIYQNVLIFRFKCNRLNAVPAGTHRTFSLLPCFLIPYSQYSINSAIKIAEELDTYCGDLDLTAKALDSRYETMNPERGTIADIGNYVKRAIKKMNQLPVKIKKAIQWNQHSYQSGISRFISFAKNYKNQSFSGLTGIIALSWDYYDTFQKDMPYMERDFLLGTPSQKQSLWYN
jgi:hypothetical protein